MDVFSPVISRNIISMLKDRQLPTSLDLKIDYHTNVISNQYTLFVYSSPKQEDVARWINLSVGIKLMIIIVEKKVDVGKVNKWITTHEQEEKSGRKYDIFDIDFFIINPTKHYLSPKYKKLDEDQIKELKTLFEIDNLKSTLPLILDSDPIVKWFGWIVGNVLKITRTYPKENEYYRYVMSLDLTKLEENDENEQPPEGDEDEEELYPAFEF